MFFPFPVVVMTETMPAKTDFAIIDGAFVVTRESVEIETLFIAIGDELIPVAKRVTINVEMAVCTLDDEEDDDFLDLMPGCGCAGHLLPV